MMDEKHFLLGIFSPDRFSTDELEMIIPMFKKVKFIKNSFLLKQDKVADRYWFLEEGFLRSFINDKQGKDITTNFYAKGDIAIEWSSFFLKHPTREYIQALTDVVCWELHFDAFQILFHNIEAFREQGRFTLALNYFSLKNRTIAMIADDACERYLRLLEEKPLIIQYVSLKHIATYLGITDTSLSRIRNQICKK